jgi:hypothetical protein
MRPSAVRWNAPLSSFAWLLLAALIGVTSAGIFSSWLHWSRNAFVAGYAAVTALYLAGYVSLGRVSLRTQLIRRWQAGLIGGIAVGAVLAYNVQTQPGSTRPAGLALIGALSWLALVYGAVDALLLTVIPVVIVYSSRPPEQMHGRDRIVWGGVALLASLAVTAAYHLGFAEFRGAALIQPLIGNAIITAAYLLTGSPLAAILAHVIMHGAAVLHGMESTMQLPPHY